MWEGLPYLEALYLDLLTALFGLSHCSSQQRCLVHPKLPAVFPAVPLRLLYPLHCRLSHDFDFLSIVSYAFAGFATLRHELFRGWVEVLCADWLFVLRFALPLQCQNRLNWCLLSLV
jgi:hypothetical protein